MLATSLYVGVFEGYFRGIKDGEFFVRGVRYEGRDAVIGGRIVLGLGVMLAVLSILV